MICDSCGQPIDPDEFALRRVITDPDAAPGIVHVIGQWTWHQDCPPAGPDSDYDRTEPV